MLTRLHVTFTSKREAQSTLTAFRKRYRVALRGACITGPHYHGQFELHVPLGATGFSNAEMSNAMQFLKVNE